MTTVLITGASRGIGRALAQRYLARGARVIACVRNPGSVTGLAAGKGDVQLLRLDATDEGAVIAAARSLAGQPIDVVINNAGVFTTRGAIEATDHNAASWQTSLMTNVAAPYFISRHFLPNLAAAKGSKLAFITSVMGSSARAAGGSYPYRASKAAVTNLACNLAIDLKPRGIAVGAYHPGWVKTDMGGTGADITIDQSADGLLARLDELSLSTTGIVADYKGDIVAF